MVIICAHCQRQGEPVADRDHLICPSCRSPILLQTDSTSPVDWELGELSSKPELKGFGAAARLMSEAANALNMAQSQRIMSRDIKPSHLILSRIGQLSIIDFGLAWILEQPGISVSGEFMGSPMSMSPQQISAGRAPLDRRRVSARKDLEDKP